MKKISILIVEPGKRAREAQIEDTLRAYQDIVGGMIELFPIYPNRADILCICNEEGKLRCLKPNRYVWWGEDYICGPFAVVATDGENFRSLDPDESRILTEYLEVCYV